MKRSRHDGRERLRSVIHTSCMIAEQGDGPSLVLYQTSLSHAGELHYWTISCACAMTAARW